MTLSPFLGLSKGQIGPFYNVQQSPTYSKLCWLKWTIGIALLAKGLPEFITLWPSPLLSPVMPPVHPGMLPNSRGKGVGNVELAILALCHPEFSYNQGIASRPSRHPPCAVTVMKIVRSQELKRMRYTQQTFVDDTFSYQQLEHLFRNCSAQLHYHFFFHLFAQTLAA